jgi:hypothetical protein
MTDLLPDLSQTTESHNQPTLFAGLRRLEKLRYRHIQTELRANSIPTASLTLSVPGNALEDLSKEPEIALCQPGNPLSVWVRDEAQKNIELFAGTIISSNLTLSRGNVELALVLKHQLVELDNVVRSQVFTDKTDADIIRSLCRFNIVNVDNDAWMGIRHEQRIQFRCTDWRMLRSCLDAWGVWLIATSSEVRIIRPVLAVVPDHVIQANRGQRMESARWQFNAADQPDSLELRSWNIRKQAYRSVVARPARLGRGALDPREGQTLSKMQWVLGYGTSPSMGVLRQKANSMLQQLQLRRAQGEFTVEGSVKYQPGQTLMMSGYGRYFNGAGIITAVSHTITPSRWITTVILGERGLIPVTPVQHSGFLPGVVVSHNRKDPQNFDRIRVRLETLGRGNNEVWARFAMPYASKKGSFFCDPEPGDEVVVGFFDNDPDYPVIIGSMHNPKTMSVIRADKDEHLKGWAFAPQSPLFPGNINTVRDPLKLMVDTRDRQVIIGASASANIIVEKGKIKIMGSSISLTKPGK